MRFLRGLRVQILLWTILPLILTLVAVSIGSITLHHKSMRDMVSERNAHLAGLAAARVDDQLQMRVTVLQTVLKSTSNKSDVSTTLDDLEPLVALFDRGVTVYDQANAPLSQVSAKFLTVDSELQRLLETAQASPGQTAFRLINAAKQDWVFFMALTDPATKHTAVGALSQSGLHHLDLFDHTNRTPKRQAYLIAPDGRVLYDRSELEINRDYQSHGGVQQALRGESGATFQQLPGEEENVVGYAPVTMTGWAFLLEEPWKDVIAPGLEYSLWAPILVLIAAVASLAAIHFGLGRIIHPLQVLGHAASRLAWGDFQAIEKPVGGIDEIHNLQSTLQDMAAQIHRYQDGMRDYIALLTQTQEDEQKRLARELHDVVVQMVIAIGQRVKILQLDCRENNVIGPESLKHSVDLSLKELSEMAGQALTELRNLIKDLRPVYLEELGLISALEAMARGTETGKVKISFDVVGEERSLFREANLAIYRIAQAAVSNAMRHGQPDFIEIQLAFQDKGILLTVEDNGIGFTPPERPSDLALQGHFGLIGMYERTIRLGGHLSIRSEPGKGTTIATFLPYTLPHVNGLELAAFAR
jgi:signal transduction histidine kinase